MIRNRKQAKRKIGNADNDKMKEAVQKVIDEGKSIQNVCKTYDIKFSTLRRCVEKARDAGKKDSMAYSPKYNSPQVFTHYEKTLLQDYLIKAEFSIMM